MSEIFKEGNIEELCNVEYGTRVVRKKDAGTIYPVYGGGGETFFLDTFNREDRVVVARFAMSEKCTRRVNGKFALNDSGLTLSPKDQSVLRQDYLDYFVLSLNDQIYESARGTAQKNLDVPAFRQMKVVYPVSLEKQREIVEKLDSTFLEVDLLEENLELRTSTTANLQASLLSSFFDLDEKEVTEDYSFHFLGSVSLVKGGKRLPKGTKWSPTPTKYPYIRVTDMKLGKINEDNLVFVPDEIRPLIKNYTVNAGDIIISIAGTIGEIAVVPESLDKASLTENAAKIILQKEILDPDYCSYFLRSPVCRREIDLLVRTTTQPKLALFRIESLIIPIPSIEKQLEIVKKLNNAFTEIDLMKAKIKIEIDYATALRQALLSSSFTQEEAVA